MSEPDHTVPHSGEKSSHGWWSGHSGDDTSTHPTNSGGVSPEHSLLQVEGVQDMLNTPDLECSMATPPSDRDEVFRLRFTCYRRNGSIDHMDGERFSDA